MAIKLETQRAARQAAPSAGCEPCPACGQLECLCRPRFFAGQLLTEEDLNRLDRYIVEKNKLHNRYLVGWGVVCGLEVVCHPCEDKVIVREGYALSPCGEDIVVCKDVEVPICDLTRACREIDEDLNCQPYREPGRDNSCQDQCQEWVLYIRYEEKPSRGITALRSSSASCATCNCGGSASCGCGCHEAGRKQVKTQPAGGRRSVAAQCEPTAVCEGYRFEVAKAPRPSAVLEEPNYMKLAAGSRAITTRAGSYSDCLLELTGRLPQRPRSELPSALHAWCCDLKTVLLDFFREHGTYDCQLDERLKAFQCPAPPPDQADPEQLDQYRARLNQAISELGSISAAYLDYCRCSQMILACPPSVDDPRVPLATITICGSSCSIQRVCNTSRKILVTGAALNNLFERSPLAQVLRDRLDAACCAPRRTQFREVASFQPVTRRAYARRAAPAESRQFTRAVLRSWAIPQARVETEDFILGALGARDINDRPLVSEEVLRDPGSYLMASDFVQPLLESLIPPEVAGRLRPVLAEILGQAAPEEPDEGETEAMRQELSALRRTVEEQQARLDELLRRFKDQ